MKKLLLSAAFIVALSGYAAAQSSEGTTTSATKTEAASAVKDSKELPAKKITRKEKKAAALAEAQKPVLISVPKPDIQASGAVPPVPKK